MEIYVGDICYIYEYKDRNNIRDFYDILRADIYVHHIICTLLCFCRLIDDSHKIGQKLCQPFLQLGNVFLGSPNDTDLHKVRVDTVSSNGKDFIVSGEEMSGESIVLNSNDGYWALITYSSSSSS